MNKNKKYKGITCLFLAMIFIGYFAFLCLPKATYSDSERRKLASKPNLTMQSVISGKYMKDFETYMVDTFFSRDAFRSIKALWSNYVFLQADNNDVYVKDGYLAKMDYPYNEASVNHALSRFQYVMDQYLDESNTIYYSIIPDKTFYLSEDQSHLVYDYKRLEDQVKKKMKGTYIPLYDSLSIDHYYRTDTHWKQESLPGIANLFAEAMDVTLDQNYTTKKLDKPFYGVYYKQAALPMKPDEILYLENETMNHSVAYDHQNKKEIKLYDLDKGNGKDPYELFLSGPLSLVTIQNDHALTDKKLIVFRDSFSSSLMPLLSSGYQEITLIDIRYMHPNQLKDLVSFKDQDVLFLYNSYVLNHSDVIQ